MVDQESIDIIVETDDVFEQMRQKRIELQKLKGMIGEYEGKKLDQ